MTPAEVKAAWRALDRIETALRDLTAAETEFNVAGLGVTASELADVRLTLRRIERHIGLGLENV